MANNNKKITAGILGNLCLVVLGNAFYALTVQLFLIPAGLPTGGVTGIALAMNRIANVPVSPFVFLFNIVMLVLGWIFIGKQFALTTVISSFVYPAALGLCEQFFGNLVLTDDLLLCTVFFGLGTGISLSMVIRAGSSTGGMDIPPLILNRYFKIPVSVGMWAFDFLILILPSPGVSTEQVLYGILALILYTLILDRLLLMGDSRTEIKVISSKTDEIRQAILNDIDRGVTLLNGETGYMKEETQIILSVISNRQLPRIEKMIHAIDPESFLIISRVREVHGRGFSMSKQYAAPESGNPVSAQRH